MNTFSTVVVVLIATVHLYIMWFEMFRWEARGPRVFDRFPAELFGQTKVVAANLGLYNGFLGAGLIWSLFISDPDWQRNVALCFLLFVLVAGIYGVLTVSRKIIAAQVVPSLVGIVSLFIG